MPWSMRRPTYSGSMIEPASSSPRASLLLPDSPALVAGAGRAAMLTTDGEMLDLAPDAAMARLAGEAPPLLVHAPAAVRRLGVRTLPCLDLLELFAFVHARPCRHPDAARPRAGARHGAAASGCRERGGRAARPGHRHARASGRRPGAAVQPRRRRPGRADGRRRLAVGAVRPGGAGRPGRAARRGRAAGLEAAAGMGGDRRRRHRPRPIPWQRPRRASGWPSMLGPNAEQRPGQADYAAAAAHAFAPRASRGDPHLVLAEAGTGTGKTLGYIAAASLWAERNAAAVWLSHLHPPPAAPDRRGADPPVPRSRRAPAPRRGPQGARELPVPAELRGCRVRGRLARRHGGARHRGLWPDRALGGGDHGRRHARAATCRAGSPSCSATA